MSEIDKLKSAADILKQVDITDIITNMGIGIAKAQEQLDNNSIKQALALADPQGGFGGKSLLELGFVPSFYSFQYADISAEIELKMRLSTEFEIGGSLDVNITKQGGYTKEKLDYLLENKDSKHREEAKSSRAFLTTSSNTEELTINSTTVQMNQSVGSVDRIENFAHDIRQDTAIDRVSVEINNSKYEAVDTSSAFAGSIVNAGGYTVITIPNAIDTDDISISRIVDYSNTADDVQYNSNKILDIGGTITDFDSAFTFMSAPGGFLGTASNPTLIGYEGATSKYLRMGGSKQSLELFFDFDKDSVPAAIKATLVEGGVTKNNAAVSDIFVHLAEILEKDTSLQIKITGYTDGSGKINYNKDLSKRRAESLKSWFVGRNVKPGQIATDGKGEVLALGSSSPDLNLRKVTVEFVSTADYFYVKSTIPAISVGVSIPFLAPGAAGNGFIYLFDSPGVSANPSTFSFTVNGTAFSLANVTSANFLSLLNASTIKDKFSYKVIDNSAYLLHEESTLKYVTYSKTQEDQVYSTGSNKSETFEDKNSKYLVDTSSNTSTKIQKDGEKIENPSTIAAGVSIEGRYSRQFSIDVSGNAKIAARMVALPAPDKFMDEIKDLYNA